MAQATAIRLTGDDLRVADVWTVAVERAPAELSDSSRVRPQREGARLGSARRALGAADDHLA